MKINDKAKVHRYNNAVKRKLRNNHITLCAGDDGSYHLEIIHYDSKYAGEPVILHTVQRNVLRISLLRMSRETLEAFVLNAVELLNIQEITKPAVLRKIRQEADNTFTI